MKLHKKCRLCDEKTKHKIVEVNYDSKGKLVKVRCTDCNSSRNVRVR